MIRLGIILSFSRVPYTNHSITRDQAIGKVQSCSLWSHSPDSRYCRGLSSYCSCKSQTVDQAVSVQVGRSLFLDKILHGLWEFALFCFNKVLGIQTALIQCCNSVTEDHSIVFLVLYVAVFNKPLDYPCYFKYREWCFNPWMSQLRPILHLSFLQVFYWELSLKFWH